MCTLPHHAACSRDDADGLHRRDLLKRLAALGMTAPLATLILNRAALAGSMSFLDRGELIDGMTALIARANSPELREVRSSNSAAASCRGRTSGSPLPRVRKYIPAWRPRLAFP